MSSDNKNDNKGMQGLSDILTKYEIDHKKRRYISREFQDYGYRLAVEMNDKKNVGMYMRLAKTVDRSVLEVAKNFVTDAKDVRNKSRLFLWKIKQLKEGKE